MTAPANLIAALPQYALGGKIGSGGMGVVYAGVHRSLGRQVAVKQLPGELVDKPGMDERFDREAKVLASLDHPHIVPVYDYVRTGHDRLLVMEKLDGATVFERYHSGGFTPEQSCAIALATLAGLHAAHTAGVLHLDVKPKNLLFTRQGVLKVADFGIAQVISEGATLVTHGGEVLGTPAYISPEQASGNPLTPAADVYSTGTVLYELLSGTLPFDSSRGALSMMRQHIFGEPQQITGVPEPIARVVMRSIARETQDRYRDAEAFAADLASAATTAFGPGWLERSGVPVHLSARVLGGQRSPAPPKTLAGPPVRLARRRRALVPALISAAALLVLAVVAFAAPRSLPHNESSTLLVNGAPVGQGVTIDLSSPVVIDGAFTPGAPVEVRLALSAAGITLSTAEPRTVTLSPDGLFEASIELSPAARWIIGGTVTGQISVARLGEPTVTRAFTATAKQTPIASAMGGGAVLFGLFALAYVESLLHGVRRGRRSASTVVGAVPLGAVFGAAVWLVVTVLTQREPAELFGLGCAAAGVLAAVSLVIATQRASS
ncbi:serine/threonine-protein kinase [Kutzneria viridogrisea]|uniref:non-specific serine/threonine protein kinase n=1 Tax=Kutzneria viridogrisea TaxID=47990 RepID=A0ABR6BN17_9PSEU|nr:serine/threonine-protein kinase [Kutzneria viridogrisea]